MPVLFALTVLMSVVSVSHSQYPVFKSLVRSSALCTAGLNRHFHFYL